MSELWSPTAQSTLRVAVSVLRDIRPPRPIQAHLLHGATARSAKLDNHVLDVVAIAYDDRAIERIYLNGTSEADCNIPGQVIAYRGFEHWQSGLLGRGVLPEHIKLIPPSKNTPEEDMHFLRIAEEEGFEILGITSYSHHQIRCFAQGIWVMDNGMGDFKPKARSRIYNLPGNGISIDEPMAKPVIGGGPDIIGPMLEQIDGEYERLVKYANPGNWTPHATFEEILDYLHWRDAS